jgi:hypothetical protein
MPSVACRAWLALCLGHLGEYSEAIAWGGEGVRIADTAAGPLERVWTVVGLIGRSRTFATASRLAPLNPPAQLAATINVPRRFIAISFILACNRLA